MRWRKIARHELYFPGSAINAAFKAIFTGKINKGAKIEEFEKKIAQYTGRKYALSVASGRMALYLSLKAMAFKKGDEIIIPSFITPEVITMVLCADMVPKFVDIEEFTYNMSPRLLEEKISGKTKAILLTHLFGQPCDIGKILKIAEKYNLQIIEDSAQAFGAEYKGQKTGSFGEISYFSLGLVKNVNCLGGGIIVTDKKYLYENIKKMTEEYEFPGFIRMIRLFFTALLVKICTSPFIFSFLIYPVLWFFSKFGGNPADKMFDENYDELAMRKIPEHYKLKFTNLQAAIGIEQIKNLDIMNDKRITNANYLDQFLKDEKVIGLPQIIPNCKSIYLNYCIRIENREKIIRKLFEYGIDATRGYLNDCSGEEIFKEFNTESPDSKKLYHTGMYLPVYPALKKKDMEFIAGILKKVVYENNR
ncbi:MAG: DegT/DnrJ/EryC1/StrS family aminotransferase [bacterium]|nr:DegT/DnrJ/EryC1/StrS family aminotransferase [bacterium]